MNPMYAVLPMFVVFFLILLTVNQYSALEWMILLIFLSITGFFGIQYFLGVDLTATLSAFFSKPEVNVDIVSDKDKTQTTDTDTDTTDTTKKTDTSETTETTDTPVHAKGPETYHIQGQFDYSMAKSVCKAYDATLASLTQIKDAYEKGAEWCDYGWSEDGMVLYPTQEDSWKLYQKEKKDKCGIPGINGGYNPRTRQRLGVNCYGVKPSGVMPLNPSPVEKPNLPKQGIISPFNYKAWSQL
jgi:hypothetical protein